MVRSFVSQNTHDIIARRREFTTPFRSFQRWREKKIRQGFRSVAGKISRIRKSGAGSPPYKGAKGQHGRKGRANIRYVRCRKARGSYRPLFVQTLIPVGFENGKSFSNRIPKAAGFSLIPESACVFVPCSGKYLPKGISTRP